MRRLLMAGGGGSFTPPPSVQEQGSWVRDAGNPIITATLVWEYSGIQEPSVIYDGPGDWKMLARAAWTGTSAIEYFTSTDGIAWTRPKEFDTPSAVLGHGSGGEAADCHYPTYIKVGSDYWCYYVSGNPASGPYHRATATDGFTFSYVAGMSITQPAGRASWGNCYVFEEGGSFYGLFEAGDTDGSPVWETYLYTSADGITWSIGNGGSPLSSLQVAAGGMYGGPWMPATPQIGGRYQLWYHAAPAAGDSPTDLYHATSTDLINWTQVTPNPILTRLGSPTFEDLQIADCCVLEVAGTSYLYYSGLNDSGSPQLASIGLATYAGPLSDFDT